MRDPRLPVRYCTPESLAYADSRWVFERGAPLSFDESYRLAHLPLVAPDHPRVIAAVDGRDYRAGRYARPRHSLVAPVDAEVLQASATFQAIEADLRQRSFAPKIAWEIARQRASRLHVTVAGGLPESELSASAVSVKSALSRCGEIRFRLGGPFVGAKNRGRIYFTTYPEAVAGGDVFALFQDALGMPRTRFYVLGYYNLTDELMAGECADLGDFVSTWQAATVAELSSACLDILATHDDLALDSRIVTRLLTGVPAA